MKLEIAKERCYIFGFGTLALSAVLMYYDNRLDFMLAFIGLGLILLGVYESIREGKKDSYRSKEK